MPWRETAAELARARAEEPITIPTPQGTLFGIHTPPDPAAAPSGYCVVLFTRPRSHRNRIWVEGARRLATRGFGAFRFDYHGTGDSEGETHFLNPNRPYQDDAFAVLAMLRAKGYRRFLVLGACFDARVALSTFGDPKRDVDGIVFFAAPVMELETLVKAHADQKDWKHLFRALGNPENWAALGKAERWRYMATVVGRIASGGTGGGPAKNDTPLADSFVEHFRALVASGAKALFVYGEADPEYISFRVALDTVFPRLSAAERARFEVEVWPGDVHGFVNIPLQRRSIEHALAWLERFHPHHGSAGAAAGAVRTGANGATEAPGA